MALTDIYYNQPFAPANAVTQDQQRAEQIVPQAAMQYQQRMQMQQAMEAQKAEQAYQNAPINPFEQDLMDLMNDKIGVKELAAKHKAMGTFGAAGQGQTGMLGGAAVQMPQPIGNRNAPLDTRANALAQREGMMDRTGMAGFASVPQGAIGGSARAPMTHRQYTDYMGQAQHVLNAKQQRDYLEELKLKNQGSANVANINAGAKTGAAQIGADAKVKTAEIGAEQRATATHERIDQRKAEQRQLKQYHAEYLQVMRDRIAASERNSMRMSSGKSKKNPKLEALIKLRNKDVDEYSRLSSSDVQIVQKEENEKKLKVIADRIEATQAQIEDEMENASSEPEESTSVSTESSTRTPEGTKYEIGKIYKIGGKKRKVNAIDPDGTLRTTVVP